MTTWHDHKQFTRTIWASSTPGGSWNQWKPISNLLLARLRYCYQPKQKLMRLRLLLLSDSRLWKKFNWINPSLYLSYPQPQTSTLHILSVRVPDMIMIVMTWHPSHGGQWQSWHHGMQWHDMSHRREQIMASHGYQWSPSPSPHNWWSSDPDAGILSGIEDQLRVR